MAEISLDMVKKLRECTGVGMSKCKEALVESGGDMQKAIDYLRKKGMASAVKKEGRETKEGAIHTAEDAKGVVLVEVNCETDFVAKNEKFQIYLQDICEHVLKNHSDSVEELSQEKYAKDHSLTMEQYRNLLIQSLGENIQIKRIKYLPMKDKVSFGVYSHMAGKIVVVVEIEGDAKQQDLAKDIAMHIAAESPDYVTKEEVPSSVLEREEEIARSQVKGKPENIIDKIVAGKMQAFYDQVCLLDQKFVKDSSVTVKQLVDRAAKESGNELSVKTFLRWAIGQ